MSYVLLDDGFHSNPKIVAAGLPAAGLYARALSYCGAYLTDGIVPAEWLEGIAGRHKPAIQKLVACRLLVVENDNPQAYRIPDYLQYNLSKQAVKAKRAEKAKSGKKGANKRWGDSESHGDRDGTRDGTSDGEPDGNTIGETMARAQGSYTNAKTNTNEDLVLEVSSVSENQGLTNPRPPVSEPDNANADPDERPGISHIREAIKTSLAEAAAT